MGVSAISGWTVPKNKGQYTLKHYYVKSHIPSVVSAMYVDISPSHLSLYGSLGSNVKGSVAVAAQRTAWC
jgi:hypothetical protein